MNNNVTILTVSDKWKLFIKDFQEKKLLFSSAEV